MDNNVKIGLVAAGVVHSRLGALYEFTKFLNDSRELINCIDKEEGAEAGVHISHNPHLELLNVSSINDNL